MTHILRNVQEFVTKRKRTVKMSLQTLLYTVNDTFNHHRNIEILMVEIYEIKNNLNTPIMDFVFERTNNMYGLRNVQEFVTKRKRTVNMGLQSLKLQIFVRHTNSFKLNLKKALGNGIVLVICAGHIHYINQTSDSCITYLLGHF